MGCENSSENEKFVLEKAYTEAALPMIMEQQYENDLEKQIFMAANLLRNDPSFYVRICRGVAATYDKTLCKDLKNFKDLLATLKNTERLNPLMVDDIGLLAVRTNNAEICSKKEKIPT